MRTSQCNEAYVLSVLIVFVIIKEVAEEDEYSIAEFVISRLSAIQPAFALIDLPVIEFLKQLVFPPALLLLLFFFQLEPVLPQEK